MKTLYKLGQVLEYNCSLSYDTIIIVGVEKAKDNTPFYAVVNIDDKGVYYESVEEIDDIYNDQVYKVWNTYGEYLEEQNKNFLNK
jgi:hypothetical protein|tara:strand:- start:76 stop:330 length:255 start_codon:yes stop_codon:yes gene_type:complete